MVRLLCVVIALFFSNAHAGDYITVVGEGPTFELAKEQAFREAVQSRAGTIVLSERESSLSKIERDDINVYSAGYVRDYKITNVVNANNKYIITMDVLVLDSKLFDHIVSSGKSSSEINGAAAGASYRTFVQQRHKGDVILSRVLVTYPRNAFILEHDGFSIASDQYRNITLRVNYQLKWNYDFIESLQEAMRLFDDSRFGMFAPAPSNVIIAGKGPNDWLIGSSKQYRFNDTPILDKMKDAITGNKEPRLMLSLRNGEHKIILQTCTAPLFTNGRTSFYGIGDPRYFSIRGNAVENGTIQVIIKDHTVINESTMVELAVVPLGAC